MKSICIFGASTTWGAWDKEKGSWVNRLNLYLNKNDFIEVYNLGISGDKTSDLLKRFLPEVKAREPNIITFAVGGNDFAYDTSKRKIRVQSEKLKENIQKLINQAKFFTNKIIFLGSTEIDESKTTPVSWNKNTYYTNKSRKDLDLILKQLCQKNKLYFLPLFDTLTNLDLEDGLHPNSHGHRKIFLMKNRFL